MKRGEMLIKIMWNIVIEKQKQEGRKDKIFILLHSHLKGAQRVFQLTCRH